MLTDRQILAFTWLIWLRTAAVRLPPLLVDWANPSLGFLDEVHAVLTSPFCGDETLLATQQVVYATSNLDWQQLTDGFVLLKDAWLRLQRVSPLPSSALAAAIRVLSHRLFLRTADSWGWSRDDLVRAANPFWLSSLTESQRKSTSASGVASKSDVQDELQGPRWTRPLQVLRCSSVIDLDSEVAMEEDSPSDRSDLSDPAPFDSPPHRRQKVERFWQKEIAAVNSMIEDLLTSEQPQFATCHSLAEWYTSEVAAANQYIEDLLTPTETATCESLDQWRAAEVEATNEYIADLLTPSAPHPVPVAAGMVVETEEDAISDFDDAAASSVAVDNRKTYRLKQQELYSGTRVRHASPAEIRRQKSQHDLLQGALTSEASSVQWLLQHKFIHRPRTCDACEQKKLYEVFELLHLYITVDLQVQCKVTDLVAHCGCCKEQALHFLAIMREAEAHAGRQWASEVRLRGDIEVDATAFGKFYISKKCTAFRSSRGSPAAYRAEASRLHPAMPLFVEQFMWRKSVGNVTAQGFLSELVKIFQSRGRKGIWHDPWEDLPSLDGRLKQLKRVVRNLHARDLSELLCELSLVIWQLRAWFTVGSALLVLQILNRIADMPYRLPTTDDGGDPGLAALRIIEGYILFCCAYQDNLKSEVGQTLSRILKKKRLPPCTSVRVEAALAGFQCLEVPEVSLQELQGEDFLDCLAIALAPDLACRERMEIAKHRLEIAVEGTFGPDARFEFFGSAVNGFETSSSDVDVVVVLPEGHELRSSSKQAAAFCVDLMGKKLVEMEEEWGIYVTDLVTNARVPVLKCRCKDLLEASL
ncbi:unnamed protein product [Durusdinium trenchii]|uniref:Poly(A) RNA polymerase mitochondrial-like central palm domain-containing protein n=1 Tax=Durusdinium trenchii TaxID=1381693 RepID=A0ABP0SB05_9DINO